MWKTKYHDKRPNFVMRMSEEEKTFLQEAADVEGLPLSTWVRSTCLRKAKELLGRAAAPPPPED